MSKYNSINDAVRDKIDKLIEKKSLDKKDYPYTADVASSLNQLASIMGGSGDSMTIADSLYDVLDSAGGGLDGYKLIDGTLDGELVIPAGKISTIARYGLGETNLTKIDLKNSGIRTIGGEALCNNPYLTEIVLPDDLEYIGGSCFVSDIKIKDISFNTNVRVSLYNTFVGCAELISVPILTMREGEYLSQQVYSAFQGCKKLKKVIITNPEEIAGGAFGGCTSLEYIYLGPTTTKIDAGSFGGVPVTCKVRCGFSEGAISGFPANGGWAGNPNDLDIEYDVPVPTEYPED